MGHGKVIARLFSLPGRIVGKMDDHKTDGGPRLGGRHVLTGPFGYTGSYLARLLLEAGAGEVRGLSGHGRPCLPGLEAVKTFPLDFSRPDDLAKAMEGTDVLYNTYWVRFNHRRFTHGEALRNTRLLFGAARRAGVGRIVHVSITNPSLDSPFEYFRGKAELERDLAGTGLSHAILRPAVLFGGRDILVNNIAWALRTFPVLGVFGRGDYGIRPIHVRDLACLMLEAGRGRTDSTLNAVGPERFTYRGLAVTLARILGLKRLILPCPAILGYAVGKAVGWLHRDIFITWPEVKGLMAGLLDTPEGTDEAPGRTRLTAWAERRRDDLGRVYASELARR
ncbi:MAG: NAD(P)H-binding protein [Deltaproteobacteria bacterium]|nr:NAD(P)H-binding protein [Deltaproteobacteria bacterium]